MIGNFQIREAFRYFTRSRRLNLIALASISLALLGLGLVVLFQLGIVQAAEYIESKVEIVAFLNDQLSREDTEKFMLQIRTQVNVKGVDYHSKAEALKEFAGDPALKRFVNALGSNPLPASLRVRLAEKTPETVKRFVTWLNEQTGVEETLYGGGDADRLLNGLRLLRLAALVLTITLIGASVIIIGNIISLMVFARREEIHILRMIGATTWFIRGPFLVWGMVQGVLGGAVASGLFFLMWWVLNYYAGKEVGIDLNSLLPPEAAQAALVGASCLAGAGTILGFVASLVAIGRQLRKGQ